MSLTNKTSSQNSSSTNRKLLENNVKEEKSPSSSNSEVKLASFSNKSLPTSSKILSKDQKESISSTSDKSESGAKMQPQATLTVPSLMSSSNPILTPKTIDKSLKTTSTNKNSIEPLEEKNLTNTADPFPGGSSNSSLWKKPLISRGPDRQLSGGNEAKDVIDLPRKRRWSDPGSSP